MGRHDLRFAPQVEHARIIEVDTAEDGSEAVGLQPDARLLHGEG
jgi:hypothetical protein